MFSHYGHLEAIFKQWINFVGGLLYCKNKKLAWKDLIIVPKHGQCQNLVITCLKTNVNKLK